MGEGRKTLHGWEKLLQIGLGRGALEWASGELCLNPGALCNLAVRPPLSCLSPRLRSVDSGGFSWWRVQMRCWVKVISGCMGRWLVHAACGGVCPVVTPLGKLRHGPSWVSRSLRAALGKQFIGHSQLQEE